MKIPRAAVAVALSLAAGGAAFGAGMAVGPRLSRWAHRRLDRPRETERKATLDAMRRRPRDLWPRGEGHVVLACPGSREDQKSYLEPGGSFSPSPGSFGVSVWIADDAGKVEATSDSVPLADVEQAMGEVDIEALRRPRVDTRTPYYSASWTVPCDGAPELSLKLDARARDRGSVVVRGVGPAGGPAYRIEWSAPRLSINDRWTVDFSPPPAAARLGEEPRDERDADWHGMNGGTAAVSSARGWAFARLAWAGTPTVTVTIRDRHPRNDPGLIGGANDLPVAVTGGDPTFVRALDAQMLHLAMSLVGTHARPGEPTNYPVDWLRDGAYVVVALARAGLRDLAHAMIAYFAENDFGGGFGPEGDAPGLALWAMGEATANAPPGDLLQALWPHVYRKAEWVLRMASTPTPIRYEPTTSLVPGHRGEPDMDLVCEPARGGLIFGRMDLGIRPLYATAVSYLGLRHAVRIANRIGDAEAEQRWRRSADGLRRAWQLGLRSSFGDEERTYISGLHPSWIASEDVASYREKLGGQPDVFGAGRDAAPPSRLWTYFDVAKAHQWLLLGDPDRAWQTIDWYFAHQTSRGLFSWSEGSGEENSFGRWEGIRGWVAPAHVTPHYWTAAEMLLFQLDALAYVEPRPPAADGPSWVIGAGVRGDWLRGPMSVRGVGTAEGTVDWAWSDGRVHATIHGGRGTVRLGPAFPPGTRLDVDFSH